MNKIWLDFENSFKLKKDSLMGKNLPKVGWHYLLTSENGYNFYIQDIHQICNLIPIFVVKTLFAIKLLQIHLSPANLACVIHYTTPKYILTNPKINR